MNEKEIFQGYRQFVESQGVCIKIRDFSYFLRKLANKSRIFSIRGSYFYLPKKILSFDSFLYVYAYNPHAVNFHFYRCLININEIHFLSFASEIEIEGVSFHRKLKVKL